MSNIRLIYHSFWRVNKHGSYCPGPRSMTTQAVERKGTKTDRNSLPDSTAVTQYGHKHRFQSTSVLLWLEGYITLRLRNKHLQYIHFWGPFDKRDLTLITAWISSYIYHEVWYEISHPFWNSNGFTVDDWEWIIISSHNLLVIWLLIHAVIKLYSW